MIQNKNSDTTNKIDVIFATDNNYVQHCSAAIASILSNSKAYFTFHILDGGITSQGKKNIESLKKINDFEIIYYDMSKFESLFKNLPMNRGYISIATYYRLFLADLLPEDIKKVIYLDCDVIVKADLKNLYEYNIDDYYAGVIEDEGSISQCKRMCLPLENNYFNAGILLLNIQKLREFDFKGECFEYYENNKERICLQDQDILNGVFNGKCKFLPLNWNANARLYLGNELEYGYSEEEAQNAKENPYILHYTDKQKPWKAISSHPLKHEYWKYLRMTPYKNKHYWYFVKLFFSKIFSMKNEYTSTCKYKKIMLCGFEFKRLIKKKSNCKIFVSYHKPAKLFKNDVLTPIHVGRELILKKEHPNKKWLLKKLVGDNTGDNISSKNPNYCELTAQYWAWKNVTSAYIGFFHYRRLLKLGNDKRFNLRNFTEEKIISEFEKYDIILPKIYNLSCSIKKHYALGHIEKHLDEVINILLEKYPDYREDVDICLNQNKIYFCNMFVTKREIFDKYCEWLFSILFEYEKNVEIPSDPYQSRLFGFLSERLLNVFIEHEKRINKIKIKECETLTIQDNQANSIIQNIFSVRNINNHKVITILGVKFKIKANLNIKQQNKVLDYLNEKYILPYMADILPKYEFVAKKQLHNKIIWQYWGQGINDQTPKIVKKCIESVNYYKDDYEQIILTNETIKDYIDLPDFVYEKLNKGVFSYAFFSDLLRCCLLSTYGGIWIDATILLTDNISQSYFNKEFLTMERDYKYADKSPFIAYNPYFSWHKRNRVNWLSSFIVAQKDNKRINSLKNLLLNYWANEHELKHYFVMHLFYDKLTKISSFDVENHTIINDTDVHYMQINMLKVYSSELLKFILKKSPVHKLTYKIESSLISDNSLFNFILASPVDTLGEK